MAWMRVGDTFNAAPEWMAAAGLGAQRGDFDLVARLKGHTMGLFAQSAVAWTNYVVSYGAAVTVVGMQSVDQVVADLVRIGVLSVMEADVDGNPQWKLLERDDFVNLVKSNERLMKTKRRRDRSNAPLVIKVLLRDGDECRYCGVEVRWGDTKSDDGQTFDHRDPEAPTTPDNYVQCCRGCNRLRADLADPDTELPLLPCPDNPVYGPGAMKVFRKWTSVTASVSSQLGVANPLFAGSAASPVLTASEATASSVPTIPSPEPAASQAECVTQLPEGDSSSQVVAANEKPRSARRSHAASMGEAQSVVVQSSSPALPDCQSGRAPQSPQSVSVRTEDSANEKPVRVQSRRRRGRRNR